MPHEEGLICKFVANWLNDNFDKITYDLSRSSLPTKKRELLQHVEKNPQTAMWVIRELAYWDKGLEEPDITVYEGDGFTVYKIDTEFIRVETVAHEYKFKIVKERTKTVTYYE